MCPLVNALKKENDYETLVCVTGQHKEMLDQVLHVFDVEPDYNLDIMKAGQNLYDVTENVLSGMNFILKKEHPDLVLVHGDTTTTFSAGLAAFYQQIPIGHVEAGLRTFNLKSPYPEEFNRQAISIVADYNFAPTLTAKNNLLREGRNENSIFVTGNTVIDALRTTICESYRHEVLEWAAGSRLVMLTAHRRENLGKPLYDIFSGIKKVLDEVEDIKVIYPIHMNPAIRNIADEVFGKHERIRVIEPLDVLDFHNFMKRSYLILTDSGGVQEEATALGKPVLVLRNTTERPEGVEAGTLKLIGTDRDVIAREFRLLLDDRKSYEKMSKASNPYGDGNACRRIISVLRYSL